MDQPTLEQQRQILEQDMERLSRAIAEQKERSVEQQPDKQVVKESLRAITGPSAPAPQVSASKEDDSPLPNYMQGASPDAKLRVEKLLELSIDKGIETALGEAKKDDPYILDAFHDALVEKLYPELQKRGFVK